MRNYDELVAAATATGTFTDYVGDGFSVPWQVALPGALPVAVTLLAYKTYLDARWPAGAKLHDWCYTPYGTAIEVTRLEADNALREYIARDSLADSIIVYAAVRAGGGPYFGVSQTGYSGIQAYRGVPSLLPAPPISPELTSIRGGEPSMALKVSLLINGATAPDDIVRTNIDYRSQGHGYGFSEGFWYDGTDNPAFRGALLDIASARNELLPAGCSVIAARIYDGGGGAARVQRYTFGNGGLPTDQVNVALYCRTQQPGNPTQRGWWLHTIPDDYVLKGEFAPSVAYAQKIRNYFLAICTGGWRYLAKARTQLRVIDNVTQGGLVTLTAASPYAVGNFVSVRRTTDSNKRRRGFNGMVASVGPLANQFTIAGWNRGATTGGSVFIPQGGLYPLGTAPALTPFVERVGTKKVGRPFELYRGRKSQRQPSP